MPKTLKECLASIGIVSDDERIVDKVTCDSRECSENSIYIGEKYKEEAMNKKSYCLDKKYMRSLFQFYYDDPSSHYFVIGVTGTNGKTSITHHIKEGLEALGYRCIRLGTHQNEFGNHIEESKNTTMDMMPILHIFLNYIGKMDCIIMEISTHAIEENRISFLSFDRIIYTNITPEHLDYHFTFTHYKYSKYKLRKYLKDNGKILWNYDDLNLHQLLLFERKRMISYGKKGQFQISNIQTTLESTTFDIQNQTYSLPIGGNHVAINACAVLCLFDSMNISSEKSNRALRCIKSVDGRMEILHHKNRRFVIDYAHTPASLQIVCQFLKKYTNRLICVFGCGGERDREKRPIMARIACEACDEVIVSEDNNRNEDFMHIVEDMQLERFLNVLVIEKREKALSYAFHISNEHDIILIAGKGNEQFLIANGEKTPYNDKKCIMSI